MRDRPMRSSANNVVFAACSSLSKYSKSHPFVMVHRKEFQITTRLKTNPSMYRGYVAHNQETPQIDFIVSIGNLSERTKALKFQIGWDQHGLSLDGFAFMDEKGKAHAYANECAHMNLELDLEDSDFFTRDGKFIQCKVHGALFERDTGVCARGPCKGKRLRKLLVKLVGENVVYCPPKEPGSQAAPSVKL